MLPGVQVTAGWDFLGDSEASEASEDSDSGPVVKRLSLVAGSSLRSV